MRTVLALTAACLLCTSCGGSHNARVVAAFYPIAWAAQIVAPQDHVANLTPPGAEPHDVELTPRDVAELQSARVVLYLGGGFQPSVERAVRDAHGTAVELSAKKDPHVWLDPVRFAAMVRRIGAALDERRNAASLSRQVMALDTAYREGLAHCTRRSFVTTHEAFGYLAQRYDLHQIAITGIDPQAEASPRRLAELVRVVRQNHIRVVFFERLVSPKLADTLARATGARTAVLDPIEGATRGQTYLSLMRENLRALREALACR